MFPLAQALIILNEVYLIQTDNIGSIFAFNHTVQSTTSMSSLLINSNFSYVKGSVIRVLLINANLNSGHYYLTGNTFTSVTQINNFGGIGAIFGILPNSTVNVTFT